MKYFLLIIIGIYSTQLFASDNYLLFCLGQEEKIIHKAKSNGALSVLNQEIISELLQLPKTVKMNNQYLEVICDKNTRNKSLMVLKFTLLRGNSFYSVVNPDDISTYAIDQKLIKELKYESIKIFMNLINGLQAQSNKANCLEKKIPELRVYYQNARYLLEDIGLNKIIENKHNYELIFKKILDPNLFEGC